MLDNVVIKSLIVSYPSAAHNYLFRFRKNLAVRHLYVSFLLDVIMPEVRRRSITSRARS